ncbi:MAG: sodium:proton antiporter [Bacteroidota bacterium]
MLELAGIIILGILAQWLAWRIKVPAILPLILTGLLVGPISTLWTADGSKLINPVFDPNNGEGLFPGQSLFYFVSLAIGIILFEGGLTLKKKEVQDVGPVIVKLITVGSVITFIGAGLAAHFLMNLSWAVSFLFAALVIVTGPTVIAPILMNVPLTKNVSTILKWEGILIDPIGALVAVLVFEFIASGQGGIEFSSHVLISFAQILLIGLAAGGIAAFILYELIRREWVPHYLLNVFTLALVLMIFVFSDILAKESGLLAVVIMGMILANLNVPQLKDILSFKESLSVLLISILFILLAANINMEDLQLLLNWNCLLLFGIIILVLRPLGVFVSTGRSGLSMQEKLFVSWVGPRGIVAAGIASLFGIKLMSDGVPGAEYITPLVFMVVLGTVLLNATTARFLAKRLGVTLSSSEGIMIIGANIAARTIAKYLTDNGRHVVLVDTNNSNLEKAQKLGLEAFRNDVFTDDMEDHFDLLDVGYLIAMTSSPDVNNQAIKRYQGIFGEMGTFRLITSDELKLPIDQLPHQALFLLRDDYLNLNETLRDYPNIYEINIRSKAHFLLLMKQLNEAPHSIPLLFKDSTGKFRILTHPYNELPVQAGNLLVYAGKAIDILPEERPAQQLADNN